MFILAGGILFTAAGFFLLLLAAFLFIDGSYSNTALYLFLAGLGAAVFGGRWLSMYMAFGSKELYLRYKADSNRIWQTWTYERAQWRELVGVFQQGWLGFSAIAALLAAVFIGFLAYDSKRALLEVLGFALAAFACIFGVLYLIGHRAVERQIQEPSRQLVFHPEVLIYGRKIFRLDAYGSKFRSMHYEEEQKRLCLHISKSESSSSVEHKLYFPLPQGKEPEAARRLVAMYMNYYKK